MKFTGKQIRIELYNSKAEIFRGSAFTLVVSEYEDYSWVTVFCNGKEVFNTSGENVISVHEGGYSVETLK